MNRRQFLLAATGVALLAFLLREWFVLTAVIPNPNQGDVGAYLRYAQHLVWDGVYTQAKNGAAVLPDAYRSPGYPLLLAGLLKLVGMDGWFAAVYQVQVLLGVATVVCVMALARQWLSHGWSLAAGVWMALQPHHIAATGAMLTEVLLGLCIVGGLLCAAVTAKRRSLPLSLAAGAIFGLGYLVNPVMALFPFLLIPLLGWRHGMALVFVSLLAVGGWSVRNSVQHASGDSRAWENLVQGSQPGYHHAAKWWVWHPDERRTLEQIKAETATIKADHAEGLRVIGARLASDPDRYARWYALEKPFLLWDWDIRMGQGGVYTLGVRESMLESSAMLVPMTAQWSLNPLAFALAVAGMLLAVRGNAAARMAALFFLYITAVHVVFQAEPRYAIAYRPVEIMLAVSAMAWLLVRWRSRAVDRAIAARPVAAVVPSD